MPLSWDEIRHCAIAFRKEGRGETGETAERQSHWNDSFSIFGARHCAIAGFGGRVKKLLECWNSAGHSLY